MWNNEDKNGFNQAVRDEIGQVPKNSPMWSVLCDYASSDEYNTFIEVGSWNGWGSTSAFVEGFKRRKHVNETKAVLYTLECNKDKAEYITELYRNNSQVQVIHAHTHISDQRHPLAARAQLAVHLLV